MRGDMGKTVPVLRDFWVETTLAPFTPGKTTVANGQALSNQREMAMVSKEVGSSSHCTQAEGWTPVYKPQMPLPESTSNSNSIHQDRLFASRNSDPLAHWRGMRFSDLLALNHGLMIPMGGNQASNGLLAKLDSQCQTTALMSEKQESLGLGGSNKTAEELGGSNQRTEIQQNAEKSRPVIMMNAFPHGCIPVFAPATPGHFKKLEGNAVPGKSFFSADRHPNKQNGENSQVSAIDDLLGIHRTQSATDSIPIERYDPYEEDNPDLDLNKTSQQKPRRKKHRPKVVSEAKPKQTPQQRTPKPTDANETPRPKRKCVRKNKANIPSTTPPERKVVDCKIPHRAIRSCRKALNFDLEKLKENTLKDTLPIEQLPQDLYPRIEKDLVMEATREAHSIPHSTPVTPSTHEFNAATEFENGRKTKNLTAISLQKGNSTESMDPEDFIAHSPYYSTRANSKHNSGLKRANSCSADAPNMGMENLTNQCTPSQANYLYLGNAIFSCAHGVYFPKIHKKRRTEKVLKTNTSHILSFTNALKGIRAATSSQNYPGEACGIYFPEIRKKRRTEKVLKVNTSRILSFTHSLEIIREATGPQNYRREAAKTSKLYSIVFPHFNIGTEANSKASATSSHQDNTQFIKWGDINKLFKRFIAPICVHDLDSQDGIRKCKKSSRSSAKGRVKGTQKKHMITFETSCTESHPIVCGAKHDTRRSRKHKSSAMVNKHSLTLYDDRHFTENPKGSFLALPWINTNTANVEATIEGMMQLSINREGSIVQYQEQNTLTPYHVQNHQTNALVLYGRDGVIIPFVGAQSSKRRKRAKVDLDDETNRVWNLLLEDINNQGIDGTDEEKTKWWEEERNIFRGRVDSFIARMRLVQGDRRFSPWKGSVVDSVVGVFLTQNVSDHLSSSAYMSLAARYPPKSAYEVKRDSEEELGLSVKEPEICIVELDDNSDSFALNEKTVEGHICDRNSRNLHDNDASEEKVVDSEESHGYTNLKDDTVCLSLGKPHESQLYRASSIKELDIPSTVNKRSIDDVTSSQNSVSSQNSIEFPSVPTSGSNKLLGLPCDNSSEGEDATNSLLLLQLAETPMLQATNAPIDQVPSCQSDVLDQEEIIEDGKPLKKAFKTENDSFSNVPNKCSTIYQLDLVEEYPLHTHSVDEDSRSVNSTSSVENLTTESAAEFHLHKKASTSNLGLSSPAGNVCSSYILEGEDMIFQSATQPVREQQDTINPLTEESISPQLNIRLPTVPRENVATESTCASISTLHNKLTPTLPLSDYTYSTGEAHKVSKWDASKRKTRTNPKKASYDWDSLRKQAQANGSTSRQRTANTMDSLDWEAIRCADVNEIADTIRDRGMNNMLAERIKEFLDRLVNDHGSIDLEWLRDVPPDKAKEYLLSIRGLGLKSVECVRLLTLHHLAFPVDTNVGRIAVRLGWVPLQPLPESLQLHLLELYPVLESIQKYLWPRLCKLDQRTLYELHYHMITFGKVFCTKRQPNCNACPLRGECRHFASAFASARLALPGPQERSIILSNKSNLTHQDPQVTINSLPMPLLMAGQTLETKSEVRNCEPIVELPASPEHELEQIQTLECDIEDAFSEDPNEIPTIKLNMEEFTQTLQAYMQSNKELQEGDMSKALVALAAEAASIPTPKLKNVSRLRTEHHVYELPDTHHLLRRLDKREPDDPCPYLLAIWSPGETANSTEPPGKRCTFQEPGQLCSDETCFYCNGQREENSQIVRGTLLIPCRTAMRGSFPLNGTYFQVNEVFADQDSSLNPIQVPRASLWNLQRRTVYFGTSIPTIFKGLSTEGIQHCFWRGYVCVRGFDQKTRAPRPLMARLHFPASKSKARRKSSEQD